MDQLPPPPPKKAQANLLPPPPPKKVPEGDVSERPANFPLAPQSQSAPQGVATEPSGGAPTSAPASTQPASPGGPQVGDFNLDAIAKAGQELNGSSQPQGIDLNTATSDQIRQNAGSVKEQMQATANVEHPAQVAHEDQQVRDRQERKAAADLAPVVDPNGAGVFTQFETAAQGNEDPRADQLRADYALSLSRKPDFAAGKNEAQDVAERLKEDAPNALDKFGQFEVNSLNFAQKRLQGRVERYNEMVANGADPQTLQAEADDINKGQAYLKDRYAYLVKNMPKSDLQKLIDQRQAETDAYQPGVLGKIRQGERAVALGFGENLMSTVAGAARIAANLTNTGDGYSWEDRWGDFFDSTVRKDQAYLPSEWQGPMIETLPDGTKKYNILPTLLRGAGSMGALVATGSAGGALGRAAGLAAEGGLGLAAEGMAANTISRGAGMLETMGAGLGQAGQQAGLTTSMFLPSYDQYVKSAMAEGVDEKTAEEGGKYYAMFSALVENLNPQLYLMNPGLKTSVRKGFLDAVKNGVTNPKEITAYALKQVGKEGGKEALENVLQSAGERATNFVVNGLTGSNLEDKATVDGTVTDVATGFILGGLASAMHTPTAIRENKQATAEAMRFAVENPEAVDHMITLDVPKEQQEAYREKVKELVKTYKGNNLTALPTDKAAEVATKLDHKKSVEKDIKENPIDPTLAAVNGDPRKTQVTALTMQAMEAMGIKPDDAVLALAGQGMLKVPEGAKIITEPSGKVSVEVKEAKEGEKGLTKKEVIADLQAQADKIKPKPNEDAEPQQATGESGTTNGVLQGDLSQGQGGRSEIPPIAEGFGTGVTSPSEQIKTNEPTETTTSAAPPEGGVGEAGPNSVPEKNRVEPSLTKDIPDDQVSLASAYLDDKEAHTNESNPEAIIYTLAKGNVGRDSYMSFGDRNNVSDGFAKHYLRKDGRGIDEIAQEASEISGREITPQDVVDVMENNPQGRPMRSERMDELDQRHKALYGKKLNALTAKKILADNKGVAPKYTGHEQHVIDEANREGVPLDAIYDEDIAAAQKLDAQYADEWDAIFGETKSKDDAGTKEVDATGDKQVTGEVRGDEGQGAPIKEGGDQVKKTLVTKRAYEGEFRDEVKQELEKFGLTRDVESHKEAKADAEKFVDKVGIDAATEAVRRNDVVGAQAAYVWESAMSDLQRQLDKEQDPDRLNDLAARLAGLMKEAGQKQLEAGRFSSAWGDIYRNSDLGFNSEAKIKEYKDLGLEPTEEQVTRWREVDKELKDLKEKLAEAEKAQEEAVHAATLAGIAAGAKRNRDIDRKKTYTQRSKELADKFRKLKTKPFTFLDADGKPIEITKAGYDWNDLIEIGAKVIEKTGKVADAIAAIARKLDKEDWYKNLEDRHKKAVLKQVEDHFKEDTEESITGSLKIPKSLVRDIVEGGAKDIHEVVAQVKEAIKEEYPDVTDREVRDAITEYGKVVNMSKDDVSIQIRRMKDIGRTLSALEDVAEKKRPLRSGLQRDKLDAEQRDLHKKLREQMKDLPVDQATSDRMLKTALDAAKTRTQNRIDDLQREIDAREKTKRNPTSVEPDAELNALIAAKDKLQEEHDKIFGSKEATDQERLDAAIASAKRLTDEYERKIKEKELEPKKRVPVKETEELKAIREKLKAAKEDYKALQEEAGIIERQRLDTAKNLVNKQKADLQRRIKEQDFTKKAVRPPVVADNELTKLRAQKLTLKEEYEKELFKDKLRNRNVGEKVADAAWEAYGLTRALGATGDLSFMLVQGGAMTVSNLLHRPEVVAMAVKNMAKAMASEKYTEDFIRKIKSQDWYPQAKEAGLSITDPHAEMTAREELFLSDWTRLIWNTAGSPLRLVSKSAHEKWNKANPFRSLERGAVGYLDTLRAERYLDGKAILDRKKAAGETIGKQDYKDVADAVNTLTGRGSLGKAEALSKPLTKIFFSPRLWASAVKTATPYGLYHFGKMTPTARKLALHDLGRMVGATLGIVMAAAASLNYDDDPDTNVEMDPRSSDFLKIRIGKTRIDPWGGKIQQVVLMSRIAMGAASLAKDKPLNAYKDSKGELMPLGLKAGVYDKSPTMTDLGVQMATNKLAPSASFLYKAASTKVDKDGNRVDKYGNPYNMGDELVNLSVPIYWGTVNDIVKDDPNALKSFEMIYGLMGGGVQTYKDKPKKKKANTTIKDYMRRATALPKVPE